MSLSLEEIIADAIEPYEANFSFEEIAAALRSVASDYENTR